jgi:hypothetical protein
MRAVLRRRVSEAASKLAASQTSALDASKVWAVERWSREDNPVLRRLHPGHSAYGLLRCRSDRTGLPSHIRRGAAGSAV